MKHINAQQKKQIVRGEKWKKKGGEKTKFFLLRMPEDNI